MQLLERNFRVEGIQEMKRQIRRSYYERWNDYRSFAVENITVVFIVFEKRKQYNLCNETQEIFL